MTEMCVLLLASHLSVWLMWLTSDGMWPGINDIKWLGQCQYVASNQANLWPISDIS